MEQGEGKIEVVSVSKAECVYTWLRKHFHEAVQVRRASGRMRKSTAYHSTAAIFSIYLYLHRKASHIDTNTPNTHISPNPASS